MSANSFVSTRISASAGSGKTYQLVLRYIALLVLGVEAERIIALTFTRKAAAEFTSRIMERLAKAASSDRQAAILSAELLKTIKGGSLQPGLMQKGADFNALPDRALYLKLLRQVVEKLGKLNMSTLDSFFSRMLSALKLDLGMADISVATEDDLALARDEVFREIYASEGLSEENRNHFLDVFKRATIGKETDRLDTGLRDFVSTFHEYYLNAWEESRWGDTGVIWQDIPWWYEAPEHQDVARLAGSLNESSLLLSLESLDEKPPEGRAVKMLLKWKDALEQGYATGSPVSWPSFADVDFLFSLRSGYAEFSYYKRSYALSGAWARGLAGLSAALVNKRMTYAFERTKGVYGLISMFERLYDEKVRRRGKLMFSDVARFLLPEEKGGLPKPDEFDASLMGLSFRMDGWFSHWMLDEFQDTSNVQWNIIEPFLDEVVQDPDGSRSLFVVGDTKQSIYQWRGGSPRIFDALMNPATIWGQVLQPWSMDVSYRSAPPVLDLVNAVCDFGRTATMAHAGARRRWQYASHTSGGSASGLTGSAEVWQVPRDGKDDAGNELAGTAEQRAITECLRRINPLGRGLSCAILVGTNDQANTMKEWLMSEDGGKIPANVETDVSVGIDSPIGAAMADFFVWLRNPADQFAWGHLLASPLRQWLSEEDKAGLWQSWRNDYERAGVLEVLRLWEDRLRNEAPLLLTPYQTDRLGFWKQAAADFDAKGGTLDDWLACIRAMKKREHSRDDSVQIMTWHKSKGLEFDVLLLPMADLRKFDDGSHFNVLKQEDEWGGVTNILLPPESSILDKDVDLSEAKRQWEEEQQFEGFCKLYVALTRAKRGCYVFIPPSKGEGSSCSPSAIIHEACRLHDPELSPEPDEVSRLLSFGNPDWFLKC